MAYLHDAEGKIPHPRTQLQLQQALSSAETAAAAATGTATAAVTAAAAVQGRDSEQSTTDSANSSSSSSSSSAAGSAIDDATVVSDTYTDAEAAAAVMESHTLDMVTIVEALRYMTKRMEDLRSASADVERTVAPLDEQFDARVDQLQHWDAAAICTHDPAVAEYCILKGQNQNLLAQREHGKQQHLV
jgi:hypothetical protein